MLKLPIEYLRRIIEETEFILRETNNVVIEDKSN